MIFAEQACRDTQNSSKNRRFARALEVKFERPRDGLPVTFQDPAKFAELSDQISATHVPAAGMMRVSLSAVLESFFFFFFFAVTAARRTLRCMRTWQTETLYHSSHGTM